ncbi:autotransporter domain-containing protein [Desulfovibrio piger]|uniref:autotransporter domain-containing protein n=1 Tax=Desulfovibrio piger TaxID=901 RepID=UPI0026F0FA95|nr:autotransporter domain-containing protein [Desulfovibrio piger]
MQLTKGAIGNLINRYKAVLKKCHLMNTFGSLAVAGMLVMGGAAAAGAAQWQDMPDNPTITIDQPNQQNNYADVEKGQTVVVNGANTATGAETSMAITGQEGKPGVNRGEIWVVSGEGGTGNGYAEGMGGVYNSQFSIVNEGSIFVDGDSASKAKAMSVNPNGSAENKGLIVIKNGGGIVDNSGSASKTMINSGTIAVEGEGGVGIFYRKEAITDGEVANRGTITVSNGGIGVQISNDTFNSSYNNKVFINSGTIIADADSVAIHTHYTDNATIRLEGASHVDGLIKLKGTNNKLVIDGVGANGQESLHVEGTLSGSISNGSNIAFTEDSQLGIDGAYSIDNTSTATLNNVTFIAGDNDASKALVVIDSDSVTLNGGLNTGAEADNTIDSMATTNGNATINGAVFKNNTFTADRNYPIIGAVAANLGDQQSLTITGSTFEGNTVKLTGTGSSGSAGGAAVSVVGKGEGSTLTIADSTFTGNHYQDTSSAANGAYGGAIGVQNASVTLSNVEMTKNSADSGRQVQGGAYYQSKGSLTADHITVSENTVTTTSNVLGGGMSLFGVGGSISNSDFAGNIVSAEGTALGGGLYMRGSRWGGESDLQFSISNTSFTGNELTSTADGAYGGGLYVKGDASNGTADGNGKISLELAGVTFDGNKVNGATESQGGALYILGADDPANATVSVSNSIFSNNKAEGANGWGGAIYNAGTLSVDSTRFENNTASAQGGAIYVHPKAELDVTNSYFKGNSGTAGGAVAIFGDNSVTPEHSISNTVFEGNTATREGAKAGKGGAIAILEMDTPNPEYTTALDLSNVTFLNNTSNGTGGAIHSESGTLTITDATFSGNSAEQQGGAIYNDANSSITFKGTNTFSGNTAAEGKDIYNAGSLTMSSGSDLVVYGSGSILNAAGGNINVENGARLTIADAVSGGTYTVVSGEGDISFNGDDYNAADSTGWKGENLQASSDMFILTSTDGMTFTAQGQDAHDVFTGLDDGLADAVNNLYARHGDPRNGWNYADVDAEERGIRFLSRATDKRFIGADHQAAAATIESAARIAFAGAVPQMTKMASDAGTNAVVNRLGFADPVDGAQAMDAEGKIVDRNTTGFALWIAPLWQSQHGWGMEAGNLDYGFNGNLGGVSLGADYTFENAIRAGITFNIGGGYAESSGGDLNSTENRMSFWGLGAYAGWNYENFGLMADVSYTSTWNDLKQDMDSRMGMGDLEADVQASAISAGLRAEYKLETSVLDVIPHIGVRYMSLNTWGFDAESNGGTVLEGDGFHQDIWTFPVGVTFTKDFTLDSGWSFKPSIDFSVIPAAGDIKAKQDVAFTGLPGSYEVETQMMDYLTWQGGVGLEMGNDTMSFGVNYTLQAGQHTTGHGVFGSFRYEF